MPRFLDAAINNPTKENVETYLYAQRVAMDKSQRYAEMTQRVVAADPFLDENNRVPIAAYTKSFFLRQFNAGNAEALKHIAKVGGLWVFSIRNVSIADRRQTVSKRSPRSMAS